ncbi:hypothetical protein WG922_20180 [Ramlibacter sp. AN1015]|uniref:hypothetical protein n=1 Tax=Ramlibacter sp. AN1015 TaxID=3133428 RepID=UPI0030C5569D
MPELSDLHLEHARHMFLSERSRRETIRGSISTPVAAISFAVFAFSSLVRDLDADRWQEASTVAIMVLGAAAIAALFPSAWQVVMSEWLFVYHEPPRLEDFVKDQVTDPAKARARLRAVLAASYAVAYDQYLRGNAASSRHLGPAADRPLTAAAGTRVCGPAIPSRRDLTHAGNRSPFHPPTSPSTVRRRLR